MVSAKNPSREERICSSKSIISEQRLWGYEKQKKNLMNAKNLWQVALQWAASMLMKL
jgi:hypothetical protein